MKTPSSTSPDMDDSVKEAKPNGRPVTETVGYAAPAPPRREMSPFGAPMRAVPKPSAPAASPAPPPPLETAPRAPAVATASPVRSGPAIAATVGYDARTPVEKPKESALLAKDATLLAAETGPSRDLVATAATLAQPASTTLQVTSQPATTVPSSVRTTVLPRIEWNGKTPALSTNPRPRFERLRPLGEGGVGEVALAHDHDIDRDVAIKRLHPHFNDTASLVRFAEEVRVVGKLEHPNIAPIHDVGIDEGGQHYFLMKYVEGDTLEHVIERLIAKDPTYEARYSYEARVEIFRGILRALQYAHARGVIHRDIKPSNVMVGPFGEVVLMDWGIAKQLDVPSGSDDSTTESKEPASERLRIFSTRHGSLVGTPAYMSPEQARGNNAAIDQRSDIYSACVLFSELMTLEHHLGHLETVPAVIATIVEYEPTAAASLAASMRTGAPAQYLHLVRHGMAQDPAKRYQSVEEILYKLQAIADGHTPVECPVTLMKRVSGESLRFVDRHPVVSMFGAYGGVAVTILSVGLAVSQLVHHFVR